jgi:rubredoxin
VSGALERDVVHGSGASGAAAAALRRQATIGAVYSTGRTPPSMKKYMCLICGYIYDEAAGAPEEGIAPGTRWEDVPPNWTCPECGARKEDFELVEF